MDSSEDSIPVKEVSDDTVDISGLSLSLNEETGDSTTSGAAEDDDESESDFYVDDDVPSLTIDGFVLPEIDFNTPKRNVLLIRQNFDESFGFALQSYVFKRASSGAHERITYVDYVQLGSPADRAGIQQGDVLVSVNGSCVLTLSHAELVDIISKLLQMSVVVVFKDIARVVDLTVRSMKLRYLLEEKERMLRQVDDIEKTLIDAPKCGFESTSEELYSLDESDATDSATTNSEAAQSSDPSSQTTSSISETHFGYRHLIRIDSKSSAQFNSPQITRL